MTLRARINLLCWMIAVVVLPSTGQSHPATPAKSTVNKAAGSANADVPVHPLEFKKGDPVPNLTASPIIAIPAHCTSDGALFLDMRDPSNMSNPSIYAVEGKTTHKFSTSDISNLHDLSAIGYYPTESGVYFLVRATRETTLTPKSVRMSNGETNTAQANLGKHSYFVARFGREGQYKGAVELGLDYPVFRLAVLSSGELLVAGYDQPNDTQRLLLLDAQGSLIRPIVLPLSTSQRQDEQGSSSDTHAYEAAMSVNTMTFVSYRDTVLLWRRGTNDPVLEIRAGGSVREVPISAPKGYALADLVPSDDSWIAHFRLSNLTDETANDFATMVYYEVMPLDGSLLRKLTLPVGGTGQIACKSKGTFLSYETDDKSRLIELTAQ